MWLCHSPPLFKLVLSPSKISPPSQSSLRPQSQHHNHGRDWPRSVIRIICKQIFIVRDHSLCKRPCMTENPYDLQIRYNHWTTLFSARGRVWKRIKIICKKKSCCWWPSSLQGCSGKMVLITLPKSMCDLKLLCYNSSLSKSVTYLPLSTSSI